MNNLLIFQSGGPTSAINASLAGAIQNAKENKDIDNILGSINGIEGIFGNSFIFLNELSVEDLELLKITPAAYLGSARYQLSNDFNDNDYQKIDAFIKKNEIKYIIIIGGNDSMDTVDKLSRYFKETKKNINVLGVSKTIDNDLAFTDHTPGYGSAIKYIASTIEEIKLDTSVYKKGRVTIVEIMGRDAGWLTAGSALARLNNLGPDLIYLPEVHFHTTPFLEDVKRIYEKKKSVLVVVSEGIRHANGRYVLNDYSYNELNDVFGHQQLGGTATVVAQIVKDNLDIPVRAIELNLMQRCAGHMLSKTDIDESYNCGKKASSKVTSETSKVVVMKRLNQKKYKIEYDLEDVCKIANVVKKIPLEWIVDKKDINEKFIEYALPLIQGEVKQIYMNGLPKYLKRK